jgi:hypothetical protein
MKRTGGQLPAPADAKRAKVDESATARREESRARASASSAKARAAAEEDSGTESDELEEMDDGSSGTESDELDLTMPGEEGGSDDDEDDEDDDGLVHVDFSFNDPRPIDFKSVRRLLEHYLPGEEERFSASDMADAVIEQVALGTMVKVNDDLDVYAFATVLPYAPHKVSVFSKLSCMQ